MRFFALFSFVAFLLNATPVSAAKTTLSVVGNVSYLTALQDGSPTAMPTGSIRLGDKFTLSATFDVANSELSSYFDTDPTVNIYYLPDAKIFSKIGTYSTFFEPRFNFNASLQIWNDRVVAGATDAQSFNFFNYDIASRHPVPFDLGAGLVSEDINLYAFDFSASARTNDLIEQLVDLDRFGSKSISYSLYNATNKMFVMASITPIEIRLSSAPEPTAWLMMLTGFAVCGAALRRRSNRVVAA